MSRKWLKLMTPYGLANDSAFANVAILVRVDAFDFGRRAKQSMIADWTIVLGSQVQRETAYTCVIEQCPDSHVYFLIGIDVEDFVNNWAVP